MQVLLELVDERISQIEAAQSKIDEAEIKQEVIEEAPEVVISREFVDEQSDEQEKDVELVITPERKGEEHKSPSASGNGGNGDMDDEDNNFLSTLLMQEQERKE